MQKPAMRSTWTGGLAVLAVLSVAAPAASSDGACAFGGGWRSTWSAPGGSHTTDVQLRETPQGITGTYEGGTLEATVVGRDERGRPVARGTWHLTGGASAGPCAYGPLYFTLGAGEGSPRGCVLEGAWGYCGGPASYAWTATGAQR